MSSDFPQVFLLIPVGIALEWFLNSVRLAVLILLGTWNETAVEKNFHSIAGWLFASVVASRTGTASWRVPAFTKLGYEEKPRPLSNPAGVYLVPLLAIIATAMVTKIFYGRIRFTLSSASICRQRLASISIAGTRCLIRWNASFSAVALGVLLFVMWIAQQDPSTHPSTQPSPQG